MSNEVFGIGGSFAFTLFLLLLRHFYLSIGRPKKSVYFTPKPPGKPELDARAVNDDAWLLWTPEADPRTGSSKPVRDP